MPETPPTHARRDVIPLYPGRAPAEGPGRFNTALFARMRRVQVLAWRTSLEAMQFLSPAILLAGGTALLAGFAASLADVLGVGDVSPTAIAATTARWTLLAAAGAALVWRGVTLAATRWR